MNDLGQEVFFETGARVDETKKKREKRNRKCKLSSFFYIPFLRPSFVSFPSSAPSYIPSKSAPFFLPPKQIREREKKTPHLRVTHD